jgi:hypothetical protein
MLRKETWFVHAITEDALTPISPILPVLDQATLLRLLRYVGAGDSEMEEVNANINRWSRGSTWIDLVPGGETCCGSGGFCLWPPMRCGADCCAERIKKITVSIMGQRSDTNTMESGALAYR